MRLQGHFTTKRKANPSITNASKGVNVRDDISICNFNLSVDFYDVRRRSPVFSSTKNGGISASL